jgi:hypothetical protein
MEILVIVTFIVLIMLVWFKSEAIIDWGNLFGLYDFLKIGAFYDMKRELAPADISYPLFLRHRYNNFITRMLACPICSCIWLSFYFTFMWALLTLNPSYLLFVPGISILSMITYGLTTKLML